MLTFGPFFLSGLSQKYKLKDIAVVGEKMKDALLASEWAELWPGARAGSHPSSAPPSLQPCPFYARLPACTTRSCAKLFPPSYDLGGQRSPRICSQVVFLGKKIDVLGWRVGGGMLLRLVDLPAGPQTEPSSRVLEVAALPQPIPNLFLAGRS